MPTVAVEKTREQIYSNIPKDLRSSYMFDDPPSPRGSAKPSSAKHSSAKHSSAKHSSAQNTSSAKTSSAKTSSAKPTELPTPITDALKTLDLDNTDFNLTKINKAYRILALKTHPDKTLDVNAEEFKKINKAHKLLLEKLKQRSGGSKRHIRRKYRKTHRHTTHHRKTHRVRV